MFFFSSRRRHTRFDCDWSSDVCSSDLIEATGRKNIIMTGLWTEVCITWPTIEMLGAGYNIYVVEDCCGATSPAAQERRFHAWCRLARSGSPRPPRCLNGSAIGRTKSTTTHSLTCSDRRPALTALWWNT